MSTSFRSLDVDQAFVEGPTTPRKVGSHLTMMKEDSFTSAHSLQSERRPRAWIEKGPPAISVNRNPSHNSMASSPKSPMSTASQQQVRFHDSASVSSARNRMHRQPSANEENLRVSKLTLRFENLAVETAYTDVNTVYNKLAFAFTMLGICILYSYLAVQADPLFVTLWALIPVVIATSVAGSAFLKRKDAAALCKGLCLLSSILAEFVHCWASTVECTESSVMFGGQMLACLTVVMSCLGHLEALYWLLLRNVFCIFHAMAVAPDTAPEFSAEIFAATIFFSVATAAHLYWQQRTHRTLFLHLAIAAAGKSLRKDMAQRAKQAAKKRERALALPQIVEQTTPANADDVAAVKGKFVPHGRTSPISPISDAVPQYFVSLNDIASARQHALENHGRLVNGSELDASHISGSNDAGIGGGGAVGQGSVPSSHSPKGSPKSGKAASEELPHTTSDSSSAPSELGVLSQTNGANPSAQLGSTALSKPPSLLKTQGQGTKPSFSLDIEGDDDARAPTVTKVEPESFGAIGVALNLQLMVGDFYELEAPVQRNQGSSNHGDHGAAMRNRAARALGGMQLGIALDSLGDALIAAPDGHKAEMAGWRSVAESDIPSSLDLGDRASRMGGSVMGSQSGDESP